ncbi:uncharacterized protein LOC8035318 isoform X1 [Ixodes scapularis]|uniref:uncharacterized protein LOC8035318 isoform X1 n=1 Tax=Ixodes scapularis TaxID=6945 RepID=UPI001C3910EA|nr:uncharacterized protein LOC8035318 isoform X1 [Ixodes scapularis]
MPEEELKNRSAQTGVDLGDAQDSTGTCNQGNEIQLTPLSPPGFVVLVVSITSALFSIYKGSILLRMLKQHTMNEEEARFGIPQRADAFHGTVFVCQGALYCVQVSSNSKRVAMNAAAKEHIAQLCTLPRTLQPRNGKAHFTSSLGKTEGPFTDVSRVALLSREADAARYNRGSHANSWRTKA